MCVCGGGVVVTVQICLSLVSECVTHHQGERERECVCVCVCVSLGRGVGVQLYINTNRCVCLCTYSVCEQVKQN